MLLAQFRLMPEQASTLAPSVDNLYFFLIAVSGFFTLLIACSIIYFAIRYRRRPGDGVPPPIHGSYALEVTWTVIPTLIGLLIFGLGARLYFAQAKPPEDALRIFVVGRQWMWKLQHPDGQREINELHVPAGVPVETTSPGSSVMTREMKATSAAEAKRKSRVVPSCRGAPLTRDCTRRASGSRPRTTAGPTGQKVSKPLARVHCPSFFWRSRAVTSFRAVTPKSPRRTPSSEAW